MSNTLVNINKTPFDLFDYKIGIENKAVLAWELSTDGITSAFYESGVTLYSGLLNQLDFRVQVDGLTNFSSVNLKEYTKDSALEYYDGKLIKAIAINIPSRNPDGELEIYWRVKYEANGVTALWIGDFGADKPLTGVTTVDIISDYSDYKVLNISQDNTIDIANRMFNRLPDENSYTKDLNSTKTYQILRAFANELDDLSYEEQIVKFNNFIDTVQEEEIENIFGELYNLKKSIDMTFPEYRKILKELFKSYLNAGTLKSINNVVKYLIGAKSTIYDLNDFYWWILRENRLDTYIGSTTYGYDNKDARYYFKSDDYDFKNRIVLLEDNYKRFSSVIQHNDIFNYKDEINNEKVSEVIDLLKPAHINIIENYIQYYEYDKIPHTWGYLLNKQGGFILQKDGSKIVIIN